MPHKFHQLKFIPLHWHGPTYLKMANTVATFSSQNMDHVICKLAISKIAIEKFVHIQTQSHKRGIRDLAILYLQLLDSCLNSLEISLRDHAVGSNKWKCQLDGLDFQQ